MKWSKNKARSKLLGEQWFQGRTGYVSSHYLSNEK
jgi:hypothetical protein